MRSEKMKNKSMLRALVESEALANGTRRQDLVEAVENCFLLDRDGTTGWARSVLERKRDPRETAGLGLLRQTMERMHGIGPTESWKILKGIPWFVISESVDDLWSDGTGRHELANHAERLFRAYFGGHLDDGR